MPWRMGNMSTLNQFIIEKIESTTDELNDNEAKFKNVDCTAYDDLSDEEQEHCDLQRTLKLMKDFAIVNN